MYEKLKKKKRNGVSQSRAERCLGANWTAPGDELPMEAGDRGAPDLWADFLTLTPHTLGCFDRPPFVRSHKIDRTHASCSCGNCMSENLQEGGQHPCCISHILTAPETYPASPYQ